MRNRYVNYNLEHGYIHNWLAAGPQRIQVDFDQFNGEDIRTEITQHYYETSSGITVTPVERGPLTKGLFQIGDYEGSWSYYTCREDHLVDHSGVYPDLHYIRSWAYTQLSCKSAQEVLLVLTTHGPADIWLNEAHIYRQENFYGQHPGSIPIKALLKKGVNKLLVRFEAAAIRACPHALALQVCRLMDTREPYPAQAGIHVTIPTLIEDRSRRNKFERLAEKAYILQDVFEAEGQIRLHLPEELEQPSPAVIRLQTPAGKIYAEAEVDGVAGDEVFLNFPFQIPAGPYNIFMMPLAWEYYERDLRITREIPIWNLGRQQYSSSPYGSYEERRQEALVSAAQGAGLFAEIAKMALDQWTTVDTGAILGALESIQRVDLLGILGMLYRFGDHEQFPKELLGPMEDAILDFPYGDSADWGTNDSAFEIHGILSPAVEILAGQRYPGRTFTRSGETGQLHRENSEQLALAWLHHSGAYGFSAWDSNVSFSEYLLTLSHLVDLAESENLREMSAVLMDKLFTTIAINSYQGVFGSTHGRTYAPFVKGGLLEPTSGITRLMWGTGIFNHHFAGTVSLACMDMYELPSIIRDIAVSKPEEIWSRERHAVQTEQCVNKVTYRTPDTMLCSAQDYCPGERGRQEHIWQATLGAAATVFVTHPASSSEDDARQPNFWAGNAILPRVAQWKDVLVAIHQLPEDDWMGFTHAYFPIYAFDEYVLKDGWAFAKKGEGYLALTASQGFSLIRHGQAAFRELRSYGRKNVWLCHMGRKSLDRDFNEFLEKVLALPVEFNDDSVGCTTLRDEALSFGWDTPFTRDGGEQPLSGFEHYEHPFTASDYPCLQMDVGFGDDLLRLNFGRAEDFDGNDGAAQ